MFKGIYMGTSAMLVQQTVLDVVGNNLANVDTAGFRSRVAVSKSFPEVLMDRVERYTIVDEALNEALGEGKFSLNGQSRTPIGALSLSNAISETAMSMDPGAIQYTDNPLDVMIKGAGYFVVEDGAGNTFYTRSGQFRRNPDGELVTHSGEYVLGDGGRIEIGETDDAYINEFGQLFADGEMLAQLQVVSFENSTYLHHVGRSLLVETEDSGIPQPVENPLIERGALERSNVQIVTEMVRMIEANRAYEAAGKAVTMQDEMSGRLFTSVGKPS